MNATINPWGRDYINKYTHPFRSSGKHKEEKELSFFSSSSSDAIINATATDTAPTDNIESLTKSGYEEEAMVGTANADGLSDARRGERGIMWLSFPSLA